MHNLLSTVEHRPFQVPSNHWIMSQEWNQLLFAHWQVDPEVLTPLIPSQLDLDTFDGSAWIAVVPFKMDNVAFRLLPVKSNFLELNVRTYVKYKGQSGVYFFSLDASMFSAVEAARIWFGLPYMHASMTISKNNEWIEYESKRTDKRGESADLSVKYKPVGEILDVSTNSIESFLTERYCLFSNKGSKIIKGDIHHKKWSLQLAEAQFEENTMLSAIGLNVTGKPLLHYSESISTIEWPPVCV